MNFIFGKKAVQGDSKESLNGIGKSTFLDLLDFCLLASFNKRDNPRLYSAKSVLSGHKIVLEFELNGERKIIKRSVDDAKFLDYGDRNSLSTFSRDDLRDRLARDFFTNPTYPGVLNPKWLRPLLQFFLKIQKHKQDRFSDPIKYIKESSVADLNQLHFLMLGIDNRLLVKNFALRENLKQKEPTIREVRKIVEESYDIRNIKDAQNTINALNRDIERLEQSTRRFELDEQYRDAENKANALTSQIKDLWFQNHSDRNSISEYRESFKLDNDLSDSEVRKITSIYRELRQDLAQQVAKTLDQAKAFRAQLRESRREFIESEIRRLSELIEQRELNIRRSEGERTKLFEFLDTREAIKDLTDAFNALSEKRRQVADLEGKLKVYNTLEYERLDLQKVSKELDIEVKRFIEEIQRTQIAPIARQFDIVYNAIYPKASGSLFTITDQPSKDAKAEIDVEIPAMFSKGKNQGRTLVYDLTVLLHSIELGIPGPKFLVHDGIFDGMDKAHLVHLYGFLESQKRVRRFQYIVTLNEEGTLSNSFGHADEVNPVKIEGEAILVLTPKKKLFKTSF